MKKVSDVFIFIYLAYLLFAESMRQTILKIEPSWYMGAGKYVFFVLNLIGAFMPLLLGIAIKNKVLKIIGIVIAALWGCMIIYSNIEWIKQLSNL